MSKNKYMINKNCSDLNATLVTLAGLLDSDDHLFIYTTAHSDQVSGQSVRLSLWNETNITDLQFATEVNKVNARSYKHFSAAMQRLIKTF
jgi:hypothetical protein